MTGGPLSVSGVITKMVRMKDGTEKPEKRLVTIEERRVGTRDGLETRIAVTEGPVEGEKGKTIMHTIAPLPSKDGLIEIDIHGEATRRSVVDPKKGEVSEYELDVYDKAQAFVTALELLGKDGDARIAEKLAEKIWSIAEDRKPTVDVTQ
ncbi:MAG: hypothetical protein ABH823_03160 [bacterium]